MSKILGGIFVGVFVSALCWEVFCRQNPELSEKIKKKFREKLDNQLEPEGVKE